jgi:hypothetical protein
MRLMGYLGAMLTAGLLIAPASVTASTPVMPSAIAAVFANGDGENCVGVYGVDAFRDYEGPCKLGAYVPPMQVGASITDRQRLDSKLTEFRVPLGLRVLTINELKNFGSTTRREADKRRIRRQARRGKHSQGARAAVLCAAAGAMNAGANILGNVLTFQFGKISVREAAKDFIAGCAVGVASPKVFTWIRNKGFQYKG